MAESLDVDFAIVGAGIAGVSVAAELAEHGSVAVLEMEEQPGYHTTGRSAALFSKTYGPPAIRALSRASEQFFDAPPQGFSDHPLLSPRGVIFSAAPGQEAAAEAMEAELGAAAPRISLAQAVQLCPLLRHEALAAALWDDHSHAIDVNALHRGMLRRAIAGGATLRCRAKIIGATRDSSGWRLETRGGTVRAQVVINATGAWADSFAGLCGVAPANITPKRRTAMIVAAPDGMDLTSSRMAVGVEEDWYAKPEGGKVLISPADETPSAPCDAAPEDIDVAICVDRIERMTILKVTRIEQKWAGLRSFAPDKTPVIGFDPVVPGFFWLAGQGGYGIQTAPAAGRVAAALARQRDIPEDIVDAGLEPGRLAPDRFGAAA
ncbi:FAD-binding oxidoreductase [Seohaeicola saemankumensis]|uniref:NAD(P)/FAD-dependent oxidoreductase n=1 Tax=Seohaeicola saemankumensis TaxID=481181 RepID=UPI0035CF9B12